MTANSSVVVMVEDIASSWAHYFCLRLARKVSIL